MKETSKMGGDGSRSRLGPMEVDVCGLLVRPACEKEPNGLEFRPCPLGCRRRPRDDPRSLSPNEEDFDDPTLCQ
jgi:hypothetical protein